MSATRMSEGDCRLLLERIIKDSSLIVESNPWGSEVGSLAEAINFLARHLLGYHFLTL